MYSIQSKRIQIIGGTLLVAGSCIGAGMLALPISTGASGFFPSVFVLFATWIFMLSTGFLLLEVNLCLGEGANIVSMAEKTLGFPGKLIAWSTFLFLFYCLIVAYASSISNLFVGVSDRVFAFPLPNWLGSLLFFVLFGSFIYFGTSSVDYFNRLLMIGLVFSYFVFLVSGFEYIDYSLLSFSQWKYAPFVVPVTIVGFGFHQLVPTLTTYFKGDVPSLKKVIFLGSFLSLVVYVLWEALVLGIVPLGGENGLAQAMRNGEDATQVLLSTVQKSFLATAFQYFAFFALTTSFLGVALSFVDFLSDGFGIKKDRIGKFYLCIMVMSPPFLMSLLYPRIFLSALNYAGGFGAALLFGALPPMMVWSARYRKGMNTRHCLLGGKKALLLVFFFALAVIFFEFAQELGLSFLQAEAEGHP